MNIETVDWLLSKLPHLSELQAYDLAEGVAERLPTSTGWDEVKRLRAKLTDASPGTPLGRLKGLARYAEEHLGHSPVSARPAEVLVLEEIERLRCTFTGKPDQPALEQIRAKCEQYWNEPNTLCPEEMHSVLEFIHRLTWAAEAAGEE